MSPWRKSDQDLEFCPSRPRQAGLLTSELARGPAPASPSLGTIPEAQACLLPWVACSPPTHPLTGCIGLEGRQTDWTRACLGAVSPVRGHLAFLSSLQGQPTCLAGTEGVTGTDAIPRLQLGVGRQAPPIPVQQPTRNQVFSSTAG